MHFKSADTESFDFGSSDGDTSKLESLCLSLGFGDVDIRLIVGSFYLVNMEGWTPYLKLGDTVKDASRALATLAPSHIMNHVDKLDDEEVEELFDQAQADRDKFDDLTPEQEQQAESDMRSHMLFHRLDSNTTQWVDMVH